MILHIGYIIQTTNPAFDPNALYSWQVWERYAKGRVLVGVNEADTTFSAAGKTAGAKTHTLTVDQMPAHNHNILVGLQNGSYRYGLEPISCYNATYNNGYGATSTGDGKAHNNIQPSIAVYMWRRIE